MSISAIVDLITVAPSHSGYAPTNSDLPYTVVRPLIVDTESVAVAGNAIEWDTQYSIYCCAASVEASYNLACAVMNQLQGARLSNTTISTSMGYVGAQVEGHYETQVTAQLNQGGI